MAAQIVTLTFLPLLSRSYGPEAFGYFAIFLSFTAILSVVATLRYELAIVLPNLESDAAYLRRVTSKIVLLSTGATTIISLVAFLYVLIVWGQRIWAILLVGVTVFLLSEIAIRYYWFARQKKFGAQSTSRVLQAVATGALQFSFGLAGLAAMDGLVLGYVISQFTVLLFLWMRDDFRDRQYVKDVRRERQLLVRYRRMPLMNGPNALVDAIRVNGINLIIAGLGNPAVLGQFSMAWKVAQAPVGLVSGAVSQVFFPQMASAKPGKLHSLVKKAVRATSVVSLPAFALLAFVSPWATPWLLGSEWATAGLYVQALCPWLCLNVVTAPISTVFIVVERQGLLLVFAVVYMLVPLVLLWVLGRSDLLSALWWMSAAMALLLVLFVFLALHISAQHDRSSHID